MSAIAGLRGTGDWGTDERPKDFRSSILRFRPAGDSPIFALSAKAGKKSVSDPEFAWWNEGSTLIRLQVNVSGGLLSTDEVITVDSADPTVSTLGALYGTATHLKPGDVLMVEKTDQATFDNELIEVVSVQSDTQFTVRRGVAGTTAAALADDAFLTLIGSAYGEGTAAPRPTSRNPLKFYNLTQIFKDSYEITGPADKTESRTGDVWSEDKKRKSFDHAAKIEASILFGRRYETVDSNTGKPKRYMGGIRTFIPASNTTVFSSAVTSASLMAALEPAFQYSTGAGDTRMVFMGTSAAIELSKVFAAAVDFQVKDVVKVYGLDFQEFITPFGRILLRRHPLLSIHPRYKKSAFVMDFDAFKYVYLRGRDTKTMDDVQTKDEDLRRGYIQTECSIMVDYGGLTMAYLGNISAT
jgi:hypothetical protein